MNETTDTRRFLEHNGIKANNNNNNLNFLTMENTPHMSSCIVDTVLENGFTTNGVLH